MREPLADALRWTRTPIVSFAFLVAAFLLLPVGIVVSTSFTTGAFLVFPPDGFTLHWYGAIVHDPAWMNPFFTSLRVGVGATALATISGTAAALGLRRLRVHGRWLGAVFVAPIALPYLAYGLGLYNLVQDVPFLQNSNVPVALGQAVLAFPIVFVIVSAGLANVDPRITDAASTLGARWPMVVWKVELPLIKASIIAAILFAFSFSFDEVVMALLMSPPDKVTLPVQMFRAAQESISPELSAASTYITVIAIAVLATAALVERQALARLRRQA
jgi:putative spermidine/putrescine transport system permease protein